MSGGERGTLPAALRRWAEERPEAIAFRFVTDLGARVEELSFAALERAARRVAARLREVAAPGDRAVLVATSESAFVRAFFGCMAAGVIPVPAPPPPPHRSPERLRALIADCRPVAVVTDGRIGEVVRRRLLALSGRDSLQWIDADDLDGVDPAAFRPEPIPEDGVAFVQYTSGSTASPRGAVITHGNLVANSIALRDGFGFSEESFRPLAWLPLFHDMGLVGHVCAPAYFGVTATILPSYDFLQKPAVWLAGVTAHRATFSLAPNFAYDLCVERVTAEQKAALDLSTWRWAGNGAEPVRLGTMERFAAAFAECGFDIRRFSPCYGLAEATLFVSGGPEGAAPDVLRASRAALRADRIVEAAGDGSDPAIALAASGRVRADSEIRIVEPASGRALGEMELGEVWLSGPSVASGYWNRPEESRAVFTARLGDGRSWLRTGDLGFLRRGALFLCGRLKDVVVLDGNNHHAHDLERTIEGCHPALRANGVAAFSIDTGDRELLVVVYELRRSAGDTDRAELLAAMRGALAEEHGVRLHDAMPLEAGRLPRTTSGKVMRSECRRMYLEGKIGVSGGERDGSR